LKRLLLLAVGVLLAIPVAAHADPGPSDEVVVIPGDCADGTTIVSAHNTQSKSLGYLIRIDGRLVEQGRLAPDERVRRTYDVPLGESHFYRIRLGLPVDQVYFSDEATTDRTNCPSPSGSSSSSTSTTPPPTSSTPPPTSSSSDGGSSSSSSSSSVGGHSGSSTGGPTVKAESGTSPVGDVAFTGSANLPWVAGAMIALLLVGSVALRIGSRKSDVKDPER
jgi:hypothetical protein